MPGQIGPGKPTTCVGGGDTELQLDANGAMFFSDLQGLTSMSNSVSTNHGTSFTTNCAAAPNTPVDRMWYAHSGTLASGNLNLYEEYDAVASSLPSGSNQLVETVSHDGLTFAPLINAAPNTACLGTGTANCVNDNEGLPGNQIVDPASGDIFIVHTAPGPATSGAPQVLIERGKLQQGGAAVTWTHIGPINAALCPNATCVDASGNLEVIAGQNFPVLAEDAAHNFYVVFASSPLNHTQGDPNIGAPTAPTKIYVVKSSDGTHWGTPHLVGPGGTNTFPWITAGDNGRVDLAWYHTSETSEVGTCPGGTGTCTNYGPSALTNAEWIVQMAQSLNAAAPTPSYAVVSATNHFIKHGQICTNGLGCTTGGDRSLGDFLEIAHDKVGAALISYVDDTSNNFSGGEAAGPSEIVRQTSGPSVLASVGTITGSLGPQNQFNHVSDDAGDATYDANNMSMIASPNLDLRAASMSQDSQGLVVTMRLQSLASLAPTATDGGPVSADSCAGPRSFRALPATATSGTREWSPTPAVRRASLMATCRVRSRPPIASTSPIQGTRRSWARSTQRRTPSPCASRWPMSAGRRQARTCTASSHSPPRSSNPWRSIRSSIRSTPPRRLSASCGSGYPRLILPRSAAKHMVMLTAPTSAMAIAAWPSWSHWNPWSSTSERRPPSR